MVAKTGRPVAPCGDTILTRYRARYGISQQALADLLGVNRSQLAGMESGKRPIPLACTRLLCLLMAMDESLKEVQKARVMARAEEHEIPQ